MAYNFIGVVIKQEYTEKITDLSLYKYTSPWTGVKLAASVAIQCMLRYQPYFQTKMAETASISVFALVFSPYLLESQI
jgi:hypothetical protein